MRCFLLLFVPSVVCGCAKGVLVWHVSSRAHPRDLAVCLVQGKRLGNLFVWFGLVTGVPFIAVLYSLQYCKVPGNCSHP